MSLYNSETLIEAGVDEVARGCLAGPVYAAAVIWPKELDDSIVHPKLKDSKKLSKKRREYLKDYIEETAIDFSVAFVDNDEIDKINILQATNLSMIRAYKNLKKPKNLVKIDGLETFKLNDRTTFIKNGDQKSISIAAASIIAKTWRDKLMIYYSKIYPMYGWDRNKGYGTNEHRQAIKRYGLTRIHRRSFLGNLNRC